MPVVCAYRAWAMNSWSEHGDWTSLLHIVYRIIVRRTQKEKKKNEGKPSSHWDPFLGGPSGASKGLELNWKVLSKSAGQLPSTVIDEHISILIGKHAPKKKKKKAKCN